MKPDHVAAQAVVDAVQHVTFGPVSDFRNLSVIALLNRNEPDVDYLTLDEAVSAGLAQITEVSDAGQVSQLKVVVNGDKPVLIIDGEELIGAKQNRVVNLTILLPAHKTTVIPVSCVESGRWQHRSRTFASAPRAQFAEGRAARVQQVTHSLTDGGHRRSDQGEVWAFIARKSERFDAASETSAMSAIFEKADSSLDEFVAAFSPVDGQVGAVFLINGRPAGLELFDAASTWRKLSAKLVRSYAIDALDRREEPVSPVDAELPSRFVGIVASSRPATFPAVGEGEDVRLSGDAIVGAALVAQGRVVHASAFPQRP